MHLGYQPQRLFIIMGIREVHFRHKDGTRIIGIGIHGKGCQWQQVDSVTIFKRSQVAIAHRHTDHVGNATVVAGSCSHPQYVMVTPLNIKVVIVAQSVHDNVRARTTVVDIAHDMK